MTTLPAAQIDWADWLRRWDAQQSLYLPTREERFAVMLDAIEATVAREKEGCLKAASDAEDWEQWWQAIAAAPGLADLAAERERRMAWRDRKWTNAGLDFQVAALLDGGFREVDVIWQWLDNRVLMAIR